MNLEQSYRDKSVFVTGHTGFKGAWLTEWLLLLGARVTGYSLAAPTKPALSEQLGLRDRVIHLEADIRDEESLRKALVEARPDYVFHLAAQPLVRRSYADPTTTFEVNVLGTVYLLEGLRYLSNRCAAVLVTSDKVYEPRPLPSGYREEDALGGLDPYSASKAAAELAIKSYNHSFFSTDQSSVLIASVRAGNVIGGGDWAEDRIVPDCIRALEAGRSIAVRNPLATRPWQFVLDAVNGCLELAAALLQTGDRNLAGAFNLGPSGQQSHSVRDLVDEILKHWPGRWDTEPSSPASPEAQHLRLATEKASRLLGWSAAYDFSKSVEETVRWYREAMLLEPDNSEGFIKLARWQITEDQRTRLPAPE